MNRTLLSITDDLLFKLNLNVDETALLPILKAIQKLEPTGVGARNLKECLIIQLEHKTTSRSVELAKHILSKQIPLSPTKTLKNLFVNLRLTKIN